MHYTSRKVWRYQMGNQNP